MKIREQKHRSQSGADEVRDPDAAGDQHHGENEQHPGAGDEDLQGQDENGRSQQQQRQSQ